MQRIYAWELWLTEFRSPDLELVVSHVRGKIREKPKLLRCLKFEWFICNRENFAEDLAEARAMSRLPHRDRGRESVLLATGRQEEHTNHVRTPKDILCGEQALKKLIELRDTL